MRMISFTSLFRYIIYFFLIIILIELLIVSIHDTEETYISNFFEVAPLKNTNRGKFIISTKIEDFKNKKNNIDIIQVGGSAGLHGINPTLVNENLYDLQNANYYNLSCCRNTGFAGYRYIAEAALKNSPNIKYVILYLSPLSLPSKNGNQVNTLMAEAIKKNYLKYTEKIYLPSFSLRVLLNNIIFKWKFSHDLELDNLMTLKGLSSIDEIEQLIDLNNGWLPFFHKVPIEIPPIEHQITVNNEFNLFENEIRAFSKLCKKYKCKLIINFAPIPFNYANNQIDSKVKLLQNKYSNIFVLNGYNSAYDLDLVDDSLWGDNLHLQPQGSNIESKKFANSLRTFLNSQQ